MFKKIIIYTIVVFSLVGISYGKTYFDNISNIENSKTTTDISKTFNLPNYDSITDLSIIISAYDVDVGNTNHSYDYVYVNDILVGHLKKGDGKTSNTTFTIRGNILNNILSKNDKSITVMINKSDYGNNDSIQIKSIKLIVNYIPKPVKTPIPTPAIIISILAVFFVASNNKK